MTAAALPEGVLVAWYGDDFTGSAATMEALAFAGLPSVLFLGIPTPEDRARFSGMRGIGIAGIARSKPPEWMDEHLPPVFAALAEIGAPISHYKICSTLDSAPHVGSIGRAIDIAAPMLGGSWHPLVVAAPPIGRYQAFGDLYALYDGAVYRLDRHPTMSRHPVTPMREADVRRHLSAQTARRLGLVDRLGLHADAGAALARARADGGEIIAIDIMDASDLALAGKLIWEQRGARQFAIGSQGVEYALIEHWRQSGALGASLPLASAGGAGPIAVVSGSCAPQTAAQIAHATASGFEHIAVDAALAVDEAKWRSEIGRAVDAALAALGRGRDPLIATASGPDDPAIGAVDAAIVASGIPAATVNERIGHGLGSALDRIITEAGVSRAVIAGGDTSGHGALALGIRALTALAPTVPGAALCRAHFDDPARPPLEIALKGGQMGSPDYFTWIKEGGGPARMRSKAA
ncbi:four-carbon acid sugar kinase family protein [Mesorhizobium sp. BR1-1-16]|uniref:four-carbon acid sugar kinase family protein n=1 Tax=Mesorhizobium sp. BR1-1-16 TaxID=2876653 RepID=UPI001CCBB336|nr:four-carbon acid sugar kinase family protein [Mesorhizobium sp. BR1-1-16]MBZ9938383.1 four-carbon acid sugar kinase family protein [Mesorhizobium sp. BR1-1-16]